jgi:hypothetical protein
VRAEPNQNGRRRSFVRRGAGLLRFVGSDALRPQRLLDATRNVFSELRRSRGQTFDVRVFRFSCLLRPGGTATSTERSFERAQNVRPDPLRIL